MAQQLELAAIEELYRRQHARFSKVALGLLDGDRDRARDAVQEAFARAIRARDGFRGEGSLEAWVWRTLTNVCLRESRRPPLPLASQAVEETVNPPASDWADVRAGIVALPERQRLMLFLRHYADLSYEEIAVVARVERGTVAATLHAAHRNLRAWMEEVHQ